MMNRLLLCLSLILIAWSCRPKDEIISDKGSLTFSETAVVFDTIITERATITKRLYIYNTNPRAIQIRRSYVGGGQASPYEVFVDGEEGKSFENVLVRGKDSLLVLIKAKLPRHTGSGVSLAYDSLMFETNGHIQNIKMLSWGQNVKVIKGSIDCNTTWTNEEPYLLMDSLSINKGCQLTIQEGTQIWAYNEASLHIQGTLEVQGKADNRVLFRYFRQEEGFESTFGAWEGLVFYPSPDVHVLDFLTIQNTQTAINADQCKIDAQGMIIREASQQGIIFKDCIVQLVNSLIYDCLQGDINIKDTGQYNFEHCTFANYLVSSRSQSTFGIDNTTSTSLTLLIQNCIIHGYLDDEISLKGKINPTFEYNIFKSMTLDQSYFDSQGSDNQVLNSHGIEEQIFSQPYRAQYELISESLAKDKAKASSIKKDILGNDRDSTPDIGAYELVE